ncbi:MAG: hypothetical protein IPJ71_06590 [Bdellovibrionales bacterium]|nr:hypothetical protein [Bdellovibrionales bacterium]
MKSCRKFQPNFLSVFLFLVAGFSFEAFGLKMEHGKDCLDVSLVGGLVNTSQCESTALQILHLDCRKRTELSRHRLMAKLKQCTSRSAQLILPWKGHEVKILAQKLPTKGVDVWELAGNQFEQKDKSQVSRAVSSQTPQPPAENVLSAERLAEEKGASVKAGSSVNSLSSSDRFSFFMDAVYSFVSGEENEFSALDVGVPHHGFGLGQIKAVVESSAQDDFSYFVSLESGSRASVLWRNMDGSPTEPSLEHLFSEANVKIGRSSTSEFVAGRFRGSWHMSEGKGLLKGFYTPSFVDSLILPQRLTGIMYSRIWSYSEISGTIFNGWNEIANSEGDLGGGFNYSSRLTPQFDIGLGGFHVRDSEDNVRIKSRDSFVLRSRYQIVPTKLDVELMAVMGQFFYDSGSELSTGFSWGLISAMNYLGQKEAVYSLRAEVLGTGIVASPTSDLSGTLMSVTATYQHPLRKKLGFFAELRSDIASDLIFRDASSYKDLRFLVMTGISIF